MWAKINNNQHISDQWSIMKKVALGELEAELEVNRERLLAAVSTLSAKNRNAPEVVDGLSIHQWIGYLGQWEEVVGLGLREIQRRKKPMPLIRAIEKQAQFRQNVVEETENDQWDELLITIDDARIHIVERLRPFNSKDLNELKRHRWLGNKPLWPFLHQHIVAHELRGVQLIEAYSQRVRRMENVDANS